MRSGSSSSGMTDTTVCPCRTGVSGLVQHGIVLPWSSNLKAVSSIPNTLWAFSYRSNLPVLQLAFCLRRFASRSCQKAGASEADQDGFEGKRPSPWNLELRHNGFLERTKTAMEGLAESMQEQPSMPRFEDGSVNLMELMRRLAGAS